MLLEPERKCLRFWGGSDMKKRTKLIFVISVALLIIVAVIAGLVILFSKIGLYHYFDDWRSESDKEAVNVLYGDCVIINDKKLRIRDHVKCNVNDVYCIRDERIYFSNSIWSKDHPDCYVWNIASIGTNGDNYIEHCTLIVSRYCQYTYFSEEPFDEIKSGGLIDNGIIYLYAEGKITAYDIKNDTVISPTEFPARQYTWEISDSQSITIEDAEHGDKYSITLDDMERKNVYAKKIKELETMKVWDGRQSIDEVFFRVLELDKKIYIICQVRNFWGTPYAVAFEYDPQQNDYKYITCSKVDEGGVYESAYRFVFSE